MSACAQSAPRVISNVSLVSGFSIVHNCLISLPLFWPFNEVVRKMPGEVTRKCPGREKLLPQRARFGGALGEPRCGLKA